MSGIVIVSIALFVSAAIIIIKSERKRIGAGEIFWELVTTAFIIAIVCGIIDFFGSMIYVSRNTHYEYKPLYIESCFSDKDWSVGGSFILGTGGFSGGSYTHYVAYGKFDRGLKRMEISAGHAYIQERSDMKPQIQNYYEVEVQEKKDSWFFSLDNKEKEIRYVSDSHSKDYILIVPENTVYKEFELK